MKFMSRSYKKTPICKDRNKYGKRQSSKSVRKNGLVGSGGNYKKAYQSYNIHDYYSYSTFEKYKETRKRLRFNESEEKMLKDWLRYYVRK